MTRKYCAFGLCKSNSYKSPELRFANFPKVSVAPQRAIEWAILMKRTDFTVNNITRNTFVCELHFDENVDLNYQTNTNLRPYPNGHIRKHRARRQEH